MPRSGALVSPRVMFGSTALLAVGLGYFAVQKHWIGEDPTATFRLVYGRPTGWTEIPHSPSALFLYEEPHSKLLLRGGMNSMQAEFNPDPSLDSDKFAQEFLDVTEQNLKDWKGEMMDTVEGGGGVKFRLVRRWTTDRTVISALAVRGNSTFAITLSGAGKAMSSVDAAIPQFRTYLSSLAIQREHFQL